jgi:hypothetical protein
MDVEGLFDHALQLCECAKVQDDTIELYAKRTLRCSRARRRTSSSRQSGAEST